MGTAYSQQSFIKTMTLPAWTPFVVAAAANQAVQIIGVVSGKLSRGGVISREICTSSDFRGE